MASRVPASPPRPSRTPKCSRWRAPEPKLVDTATAWAIEVNRRVAELDSGAVKTIPRAEVGRRLAAR